jgi:quercetin dioxygenase-like cupin family protein
MTALTALIAKFVRGKISRRAFSHQVLQLGFGSVTVESILDNVSAAPEPNDHGHTFEPFSSQTPYEQWIVKEGIPVHTGYHIPDVRKVELKPWGRMGVAGAFINLEGSEGTDGAYLLELAPGASTKAQRYMFEEAIFVLDGEGETQVWQPDGARQSIRWRKGGMLSPPLNVFRRHFNRGDRPARLISFHDLPLLMDVFHNTDFLFHNDFVFRDRYNGQPDFFTFDQSKIHSGGTAAMFGEGERGSGLMAETGFIPDVNHLQLVEAKSRGHRNRGIEMVFSDNTIQTHISEFEEGSYKRAHRHGPGSQVFILGGAGYTLLWTDLPQYSKAPKHMRIDWTEGTLLVPPDRWYHQHFNIGASPAKYMATTWIGGKYWAKAIGGGGRTHRLNTISFRQGGNMIDYPDEDPVVRDMFDEELRKGGIPNRMPERSRKG